MATLSAPYHNAMRLGQGFNSYTQQICIDNAVLIGDQQSSTQLSDEVINKQSSQIVTYSSRFVEKLSDVTDSMNISGGLSIKYGAIGGSGKGSYIDTDKFKESDLNFLIQVKVTNQTVVMQEKLQFQPIQDLPPTKFQDVFGDCFISGFLEGGEFTALISMKIKDRSKKKDIAASLEVKLSTPALSVEANGDIKVQKVDIGTETETTINVSWSGGGELKKPDQPWDIATLTQVAAKFPDLVRKCPQRTTALLTKYTSSRSFLEKMPQFTPLDYENAGVYTADLLDAYMDYKLIWKNLNEMLDNPSSYEKNDTYVNECYDGIYPYEATPTSLDSARNFCRTQMIRIVKEVDVIAKHPELAADEDREMPYKSPEVFRSLLPTRKPKMAALALSATQKTIGAKEEAEE